MFFENIKGHKKIIEFLKDIVKDEKIPSSFIFYGPQGVGKVMVAKEFAKYILSYTKNGLYEEGINEESLRMFEKNVHPDFLLVNFAYQADLLDEKEEEQKSIKIDTIRSLIKFAHLAPSYSNKKVIIIDNADTMTVDAQNALLKTLEEPPLSTIIILVTGKENFLLPTILSRTTHIKFSKLSEDDIVDILVKKGFELKRAMILSKISNGSVSLALEYNGIMELINENLNYRMVSPFIISSKILKRPDLKGYIEMLINFVNSFIYLGIKEGMVSMEDGFSLIKENKRYATYLRHNVNYKLIITLLLYKFLRVFNYFEKGAMI